MSSREELGQLIKRIQVGHHRTFNAALESRGLSLAQWKALREIDANPGESQLALADRALISAQAFGTLMSRLISRGLVKRRPGVGRATEHALTPKGKAALDEGREVWATVLEESFDPLNKSERTELARLLKMVLRER